MKGVEADIYVKWPKNLAPNDKDALNDDDVISWCWPNWKISKIESSLKPSSSFKKSFI